MPYTEIDQDFISSEQSECAAACELQRGEFVGKVAPQGERYAFTVRDLRRERPTIHGFEQHYDRAVFAMKQVMAALENRS